MKTDLKWKKNARNWLTWADWKILNLLWFNLDIIKAHRIQLCFSSSFQRWRLRYLRLYDNSFARSMTTISLRIRKNERHSVECVCILKKKKKRKIETRSNGESCYFEIFCDCQHRKSTIKCFHIEQSICVNSKRFNLGFTHSLCRSLFSCALLLYFALDLLCGVCVCVRAP